MVHLYAANIGSLPDPKEHPEILEGLWKERKEKALRMKLESGRKQCAGAGLLLKAVLEKHGISMDTLRYGDNGKPQVDGLCFNISHSEDWVICAVSDKAVGCDIEKISEEKTKVAKRFFAVSENEYLCGFEGDVRTSEFFRIWTMKESYLKMTGEGISFPLNRIEFKLGEPIGVYRDGEKCDCHVREYEIPGYKVSVCTKETEFAEKMEMIEIMD